MSKISTAAMVVAASVVLAACSSGGLPTPEPSAGAATAAAASASLPPDEPIPTAEPGTTPRPTEVPGPPVASLAGGRGGPLAGALGTFFWDGLGSDAPWIVPSTDVIAAPGAALGVTLEPAIAPARWTTAWAPVRDGAAEPPEAVSEGRGEIIEVRAPVRPGAWGLQVEMHFPDGQRGAWYWSVVVAP